MYTFVHMKKQITGRTFCLLAAFLLLNGLFVSSFYQFKTQQRSVEKHMKISQKEDVNSLIFDENKEEEEDEFDFHFNFGNDDQFILTTHPYALYTTPSPLLSIPTKVNFSPTNEKLTSNGIPRWLETRQIII